MTAFTPSEAGKGAPHPVAVEAPTLGELDGAAIVRVPPSGKHGIGRYAIVDAEEWEWISRLFGTHWVRMVTPNDHIGRVVCGTKEALHGARLIGFQVNTGKAPTVSLGRLVVGAEYDEKLLGARNGDPLDFRKSNLEAVSGSAVAAFMANLHDPTKNQLGQQE